MRKEIALMDLVTENLAEIVYAIDKQGRLALIQGACQQITGATSEELQGTLFLDLIHPFDRLATQKILDKALAGISFPVFESFLLHKAGRQKLVQWSFTWLKAEEMVIGIGRSITHSQPQSEENLRREALHQVLVQHGTDMAALIDEEGKYLYIGGSANALKSLGYQRQQLLGKCFLDFVHPDDLQNLQGALQTVLENNGPVTTPEFRFRTAAGDYRWVETTATSQLQTPHVHGFVATSKDVTERVLSRQKLQESEERYKALFQNNPNMILLEDSAGIIRDVNPAVLKNYGYTKDQVLGQHFGAFLDPENIEPCMDMLAKALNGEQVQFEIQEKVGAKGLCTLEIIKVPVLINNKVTAVYSICQDITEVKNNYKTIQRQAEKLNTILESITDAFFTLDQDWTLTYINAEFDKIVGTNREEMIGRKLTEFFPEVEFPVFYQQYRQAMKTGQAVHFESFSPILNLWFEVKAFPSDDGLSVYFNDVTEKVKDRQELEKLSLVASKTINGVVFQSPDRKIEWVNEGFTNMTGYSFSEAIGRNPGELLQGPETNKATALNISNSMAANQIFTEEILNYRKNGQQFWVALEFTPVFNPAGELERYIVLQTDITYRKETEAAQQQLTRDLFRQNLDMQQFTYIVSHNLRAPVATALGYAQLLEATGAQHEAYPQCLENLQVSIQRLDEVLKDLNQLLSIRDNKDNIGLEKVALEENCRAALLSLQDLLEQTGAEVTVQIPEGAMVKGNKVYLQSIFYNLISNAIKYRSAERPLKISILCQPDSRTGTLVTVSDNGSGFNLERVGNQVFKLYNRFHDQAEGRGVGLFLVKTQMEAMGGQIEVTSQENIGTTFYLKLK